MRNAWRLGLVLLLCVPAFAPDEVNPYDPPGGFSRSSENRVEFNLQAFYGQTGGNPDSIRKELESPQQRELVASALFADPGFLQTVPRKAALAFLAPLTVAHHRRLKESPALTQNEALRELVREGRILSYLPAKPNSPDRFWRVAAWGGIIGMAPTLLLSVWLHDPSFLISLGRASGIYAVPAVAIPLADYFMRKTMDYISFQLLLMRLQAEAREVGPDWQPSAQFFEANVCGYERLRKSPLKALRPK